MKAKKSKHENLIASLTRNRTRDEEVYVSDPATSLASKIIFAKHEHYFLTKSFTCALFFRKMWYKGWVATKNSWFLIKHLLF